ncbi:MAG: pitrilysin family protein [Candidatus Pacebacteria bacterium]|nr:pitrilysin family protein [Candidatus Paceibacterota bacterium]MDD4830640.1 pitrilysin family protein [Candidatus Paceibacterota bacterium]MDD4875170.1 pitrilysin family protein [Candidatus Paceibacterota bacterium]
MYKKTTLKNGLRVVVVPLPSSQTAAVLALTGAGAKHETKEDNGISHFLEHMIFNGSKKRPNKKDIAETMEKVGGIFNAFTGYDCTGYWAKTRNENFELALDFIADIFLNPLLPEKEIEKERKVITEEFNMCMDNPQILVEDFWSKLLYGDCPAGRLILGSKESIAAINRKKLVDYKEKKYSPSNTVVCIAGGVGEEEALAKVQEYFGSFEEREPCQKEKVLDSQDKPMVLLRQKKTDQAHMFLGVRAFNVFDGRKYALKLLSVILGKGMSSRMFMNVREKLGLSYYLSTECLLDPDAGYLATRIGLDNSRIEEGISAILKEYKIISREKVENEELKKAKEIIKGRSVMALESSDALASFCAEQELFEGEILTPEQLFAKIDNVTAEEILAVAQDIFKPEKLNLALVGPFEKEEKFINLLNNF